MEKKTKWATQSPRQGRVKFQDGNNGKVIPWSYCGDAKEENWCQGIG